MVPLSALRAILILWPNKGPHSEHFPLSNSFLRYHDLRPKSYLPDANIFSFRRLISDAMSVAIFLFDILLWRFCLFCAVCLDLLIPFFTLVETGIHFSSGRRTSFCGGEISLAVFFSCFNLLVFFGLSRSDAGPFQASVSFFSPAVSPPPPIKWARLSSLNVFRDPFLNQKVVKRRGSPLLFL